MAPQPKARENNFLTDIGVAGRKTGITVEDTGQRDAFGMEPMDGFFSPEVSPEKELESLNGPRSPPTKFGANQTNSIEESMDIVTSSAVTSRLVSRASLPPRARSPIRTNLRSPARRASSVGLSSPAVRSSPLHALPQRIPGGGLKLNRKLDFASLGQSSPAIAHTTIESSPALPPPPMHRTTAASKHSSSGRTNVSGEPLSLGSVEKEKAQAPAARGKGKGKASLEQVVEEDSPTPVAEPTPPGKKKQQKRGLLVSQRPAAGEKKPFSLEDTNSSDDESLNGTEAQETEVEEEQEEEQEDEVEPTNRDAFDEGLSHILDNSVLVEDATMAEGDDDDESLPDIIAPKPKPKPVKGKPGTTKSKAAAARKEKENAKKSNGVRATGGKAERSRKEPEPGPATKPKPKPAPKARGKKVISEVLLEEEEEEEEVVEEEPEPEPAPPPKAKNKPTARGKGKVRAVVEEEPEPEPIPQSPPKDKIIAKGRGKGRGKVVKALQEQQEIPESDQESERPEAADETEEEEQEQPAKKRSRTTKEKVPPKQKISAKAKGKAPSKEKATKATKKTSQKTIEPSPELQSFTPSSPVTSNSRTMGKPAKAASSRQPPSPQPVGKAPQRPGQRVIKEPPPPSRLLSEDMDGVRRSSRTRVQPLAYWKNEKIVYGLAARRKSGRADDIRLPEALEIVRVESDTEAGREKKQRRKKSYTASMAGSKRKRPAKEEEEFEEEDWESRMIEGEIGVVRGLVKRYPPPETPGEEEVEEAELAFSTNRIVTVEVANGDFTFVKTCTEQFFGTGMIEVPPGGIKRTKNSGKMHLVFYMLTGKVEVKIGDNSFRVRKGAQFMVPRGNLYSIQNPYDVQAKMFFAQGCEVFADEDYEGGE